MNHFVAVWRRLWCKHPKEALRFVPFSRSMFTKYSLFEREWECLYCGGIIVTDYLWTPDGRNINEWIIDWLLGEK